MKSIRWKTNNRNARAKNDFVSETIIRKRDRAATETAILLAAIQVFAKKGYDAANTRDIAKLANANEALIFRYFGNKKVFWKRSSLEPKISNRMILPLPAFPKIRKLMRT